jgi:hypothetical protein
MAENAEAIINPMITANVMVQNNER